MAGQAVKLTEDDYALARSLARREDRSVPNLIGRALAHYVTKGTTSNALDAVPDPNSTTSRNP
jgi:hypothetical protein